MSTVTHHLRGRAPRKVLLTTLALGAAALGSVAVAAPASAATVTIRGTATVQNGVASPTRTSAPAGGSHFRFENPNPPGGTHPNSTPNNLNPDYTLLRAGSGGLTLGAFQPTYGGVILDPQTFDGAPFGVHTTGAPGGEPLLQYDNASGTATARPIVSSNLNSWTVNWNTGSPPLIYNQGADQVGSGRNHNLAGTYNTITRVVSLTWSSRIFNASGPPGFNDGTGHWRIVATVR